MTTIDTSTSPFVRARLMIGEDGQLTAPDNIIQTVAAAYQQYITMRVDHIPRISTYAAIDGMVNGLPPYDQEELEANGLGHLANFNNFRARASFEKSAQGYWNLINSVEVFVKIVLAESVPDAPKWADIMARHFSDMVKEWEDFSSNFNLLGAQLVKYGICPVIFPHEESPLWEVIDVSRFYIPENTQVFLSKLTNVAVDSTYTVQQLYQIYKDIGDKDPWNKEALESFLILRAADYINNASTPTPNMLDVERFVATNSGDVNRYFNDTVKLVNMYQKEYNDGKISHYIFSVEQYQNNNAGYADSTQDFLYFVDRQYDSIEEAIILFTACPGEWLVHSNIGLGQKMFAGATAINMLDCSIVDMAKMSGTPMIRSLATGGRNMEPIRVYPGVMTDIGAAEFVQNNLGANINQLVGASQYLNGALQQNAVNGGDDPQYPDMAQGSVSPSQARSKDWKEFGTLKNVIAHFYNTFDKVVRLSFVRFLTMQENAPGYALAKEWKRRCKDDGVPEELFDTKKKGLHGLPQQFRSVKASRVAGDGSNLARLMGLEMLSPIMGTFNQKEIAAYKREYVAATVGVDYIPVFASSDNQTDEISGGASLARVEDNLMQSGMPPLFSPDNDQAAHADEHMGAASGIVQQVAQQQMSPIDADRFIRLMIPHLNEHINFMLKTPQFYRETLNRLRKPFKQLSQWASLNRKNALAMVQAAQRKQMEDQAATQQVMDDKERKDFVARADVARADKKVEAQNTRADKANETRADIMRTKVEKDADNKRLQVQLDAEAKKGATAKGRAQTELESSSMEALSSELSTIIGNSPSTIDFEPVV